MVAFALLMTPFATNPLIYVASDPNYRRRPQIDIAPISSTEASSSIKQNCRKAFVQDEKNISGLIEIVFASLCEETPWQRLVLSLCILCPILPCSGLDYPDCPAKCSSLSGRACPPRPVHRHHHQGPPPGSFPRHHHLQLQDPHHILLVCLSCFME